jgi:hypothetical protein
VDQFEITTCHDSKSINSFSNFRFGIKMEFHLKIHYGMLFVPLDSWKRRSNMYGRFWVILGQSIFEVIDKHEK